MKQLFLILILTLFIQLCPAQNASNGNESVSDANLPVKNANATKSIKLFTSLIEGRKNAAETGPVQLMILTNELKPAHKRYLKKFLSSPRLISLTQKSLTVIKLEFPLKNNSTEDEFKVVGEFVTKYEITKSPLQFMLIDSKTGKKVSLDNSASTPPTALLKRIYQLLLDIARPEAYEAILHT